MISIIVPIYNAEQYLSRCVDSILSQSCSDLEIILVNDGSVDSSKDICDSLAQANPHLIKVIHKFNEGVSVARNTGLDIAKGDYVAFLDADDDVEAELLKTYREVFESFPKADLLITGYKMLNSNGKVASAYGPANTREWTGREGIKKLFSSVSCSLEERGWLYYFVWNKLYRMDVIRNHNIRFRTGVRYGEDFLFNAEYMKYVSSLVTIKGNYYNYWKHASGSATSHFMGDSDLLSRRQLYYETNLDLYRFLEMPDEDILQIDQIEAKQIYATANWIFATGCTLSHKEKTTFCKELVEKYKYGSLIKMYPMRQVGFAYRIHVQLLINHYFTSFVWMGYIFSIIRKLKRL